MSYKVDPSLDFATTVVIAVELTTFRRKCIRYTIVYQKKGMALRN